MDRKDLWRAFVSVRIAIEAKMLGSKENITTLSYQYGSGISSKESIDKAWGVINVGALDDLLEQTKE